MKYSITKCENGYLIRYEMPDGSGNYGKEWVADSFIRACGLLAEKFGEKGPGMIATMEVSGWKMLVTEDGGDNEPEK